LEEADPSEKVPSIYKITLHLNPEDSNLHSHHYETYNHLSLTLHQIPNPTMILMERETYTMHLSENVIVHIKLILEVQFCLVVLVKYFVGVFL
jgi:hypothetical protein